MIFSRLCLILLGCSWTVSCSEDPEPPVVNPPATPAFAASPDEIEIRTQDIELFWQIFDHQSLALQNLMEIRDARDFLDVSGYA